MKKLVSLECKTIIADNAFELHKNPLPDLYLPDDFGEFVADNNNTFFYMRWNKKYDNTYWNEHVGATFRFDEPVFETHFELTRVVNGWKGNNLHYHQKEALRNTAKVCDENYGDIYRTSRAITGNNMGLFFINKTDELLKCFKDFFGFTGTNWNDVPGWIINILSVQGDDGRVVNVMVHDNHPKNWIMDLGFETAKLRNQSSR
jgi:hypothetical protein